MSVFRSLLNLLVIGVLLLVGQLPERLIFGMALAMLLTCAANVSIIQASHLVYSLCRLYLLAYLPTYLPTYFPTSY